MITIVVCLAILSVILVFAKIRWIIYSYNKIVKENIDKMQLINKFEVSQKSLKDKVKENNELLLKLENTRKINSIKISNELFDEIEKETTKVQEEIMACNKEIKELDNKEGHKISCIQDLNRLYNMMVEQKRNSYKSTSSGDSYYSSKRKEDDDYYKSSYSSSSYSSDTSHYDSSSYSSSSSWDSGGGSFSGGGGSDSF